MRKFISISIMALLTLFFVSCKNSTEKDPASSLDPKANVTATEQAPSIKLTFPEIKPNEDPQVLKEKVTNFVDYVYDNKSNFEVKKAVSNVLEIPNTPFTIWYHNHEPIIIEHQVSDEAGLTQEVFSYILKNGNVWYGNWNQAVYLFEDEAMKYWVQPENDTWAILDDIPQENRNARTMMIQKIASDLQSEIK